MAKIFFSLSGEGRGHATRTRAIIESLRHEHELSVFASHDAYDFLEGLYLGTDVEVHRIAGLRFHYTPVRRLDFWTTGVEGTRALRRLAREGRALEQCLRREPPDLVVTDFEPVLPRAARRLGVPFLSVDHQHFLTTYDLRSLPWALRARALLMACVVRGYYSGQRETVVSSFFFPPLRRGCRKVTQVGVMLRPELLARAPEYRGHLVAYWRRFVAGFPFPDRVAKRYYWRGVRARLVFGSSTPNPPCVALNSHLRLLPNGDVPVCQFNARKVGNLRRQAFDEVWFGSAIAAERAWVRRCPGCWAECEVLPNAVYTGDLLRAIL